MLSEDKNRQLTQVGPGTPMGEVLRRHWHPIAGIDELERNAVKPVRLMGEDLVLFKDLSGQHGLVDEAGAWRRAGVGVMAGERVIHMAPQASRVPQLMANLLRWLAANDAHPLIASSVFHYEFEFIHPFSDGNGRIGRLMIPLMLVLRDALPQPLLYLSAFFEQHRSEYDDHLLITS